MSLSQTERTRYQRLAIILLGLILPPAILLTFFKDSVLPSPVPAAERFQSFGSDITLDIKGNAQVAESIVLLAAGDQVKHGFRRFFPSKLFTKDEKEFNYKYVVRALIQDEEDLPLNVIDRDVALVATMGNADVDLPAGVHSYFLRYDLKGLIQIGETEDQLFWNLTGNYPLVIDAATAVVRLPPEIKPETVKVEAYRETIQYSFDPVEEVNEGEPAPPTPVVTREFVRSSEGISTTRNSDGSLLIATTKPLDPGQSLYLHMKWPAGAIAFNEIVEPPAPR